MTANCAPLRSGYTSLSASVQLLEHTSIAEYASSTHAQNFTQWNTFLHMRCCTHLVHAVSNFGLRRQGARTTADPFNGEKTDEDGRSIPGP